MICICADFKCADVLMSLNNSSIIRTFAKSEIVIRKSETVMAP